MQTTAREANDRGYEIILATDSTQSFFPEFKSSTIDMIKAQGALVGWVSDNAKIIEALRSI